MEQQKHLFLINDFIPFILIGCFIRKSIFKRSARFLYATQFCDHMDSTSCVASQADITVALFNYKWVSKQVYLVICIMKVVST